MALGNHPLRYQNTRHNLGFICLDRWAESHQLGYSRADEYDYLIFKQVVAIKPRTYMNLSGKALKAALLRWKISESLIIHDDIELEATQLRIRHGGGDGGHNGLKSLFEVLPPSELKRIRIGIGRSALIPAHEYVLQEFNEGELAQYDNCLKLVSGFLDTYATSGFNQMLNDYSKWKKSYSDKESIGIKSPKEELND
ncbi:MAG: peptidyl-tRNA hydrolase, family [Candidatus Cloacimonadota bacterium]|nr:peptidyl-tRNA hydrolase, family [Candidatus Cloacimonadota bacterium]